MLGYVLLKHSHFDFIFAFIARKLGNFYCNVRSLSIDSVVLTSFENCQNEICFYFLFEWDGDSFFFSTSSLLVVKMEKNIVSFIESGTIAFAFHKCLLVFCAGISIKYYPKKSRCGKPLKKTENFFFFRSHWPNGSSDMEFSWPTNEKKPSIFPLFLSLLRWTISMIEKITVNLWVSLSLISSFRYVHFFTCSFWHHRWPHFSLTLFSFEIYFNNRITTFDNEFTRLSNTSCENIAFDSCFFLFISWQSSRFSRSHRSQTKFMDFNES